MTRRFRADALTLLGWRIAAGFVVLFVFVRAAMIDS
jgi:hypothetical protein